jgi:hypothetical protein
MWDRHNIDGFNKLFKGGESAVQSVVAHNTHINNSQIQEGGMSHLMFGALAKQLAHDQPGKHETGFSQRSVMTLKGDGVQTRVLCGYNPCYDK